MGRQKLSRASAGRWKVRASRAGVTQRSSNAGLPLDRADLATVTGTPTRKRGFQRTISLAPPLPELPEGAIGHIIDIDHRAGVFVVHFDESEIGGAGAIEQKFSLDWLAASDRQGLVPGALVRCALYSVEPVSVPETTVNQIMTADEERPVPSTVDRSSRALALSAFAQAVNDGSLRGEIDEATGWDPELSL